MYQKWVKKEVKKRVKEGLDQRELFMLRGNPYVKVLLLTVPIVVMLLVLTLRQCLVLNVRKLYKRQTADGASRTR